MIFATWRGVEFGQGEAYLRTFAKNALYRYLLWSRDFSSEKCLFLHPNDASMMRYVQPDMIREKRTPTSVDEMAS